MPFKIERNDITKIKADAIVNTANPNPIIGDGTDSAVYEAAGEAQLLLERKKIGKIERGQSAVTPSFNLGQNGVRYIIHTVGGKFDVEKYSECVERLRSCYRTALAAAAELKCGSIAIPLLATGNYGYPKELGLQIAIEEIGAFLLSNDMYVTLVVYDLKSYLASEKIFSDIEDYIKKPDAEKISSDPADMNFLSEGTGGELTFQDLLIEMIRKRNLDNTSVYKKANIDRRFFSKIISSKNYIPKRKIVMALGLSLRLTPLEFVDFMASAGYAFMPSSKIDRIVKACVIKKEYDIYKVNQYLYALCNECLIDE